MARKFGGDSVGPPNLLTCLTNNYFLNCFKETPTRESLVVDAKHTYFNLKPFCSCLLKRICPIVLFQGKTGGRPSNSRGGGASPMHLGAGSADPALSLPASGWLSLALGRRNRVRSRSSPGFLTQLQQPCADCAGLFKPIWKKPRKNLGSQAPASLLLTDALGGCRSQGAIWA